MNKNAIKKFAIEARKKLIDSVTDKAGMLGITEKSCSEPITKGPDFEVYQTVAGTEATLNKRQCEQRRRLVSQIESRGFEAVVEEVAYTWFNRICAIRFMEVNDYLPNRVRVLSSEKEGKMEPDLVTQAPDVDLDLTAQEKEEIINWKMSGTSEDTDKLYCKLFLKQCHQLHDILPGLFEADSDYMELLFGISYTNKDDVIYMLVNPETGIPEADFNVSTLDDEGNSIGQVEIIGWLYQYYINDPKDALINAKKQYKSKDVPFVTQIFTSDWIVKYMVQNSLGRAWIETTNEDPVEMGWDYYLANDDVKEDKRTFINPEDIKIIDPCMGSGHILVYAFEVLMQIYEKCGYGKNEAAELILTNNLYGLDISKRAYQLAYFSIMMIARKYCRRIFKKKISLNICCLNNMERLDDHVIQFIANGNNEYSDILSEISETFKNLGEIGSLITPFTRDYTGVLERIEEIERVYCDDLISFSYQKYAVEVVKDYLKIAGILINKYDVVITNPPYIGNKFLPKELKVFIENNYKKYKSDVFSAFIVRIIEMCKKDGAIGMLTPYVWMFISTYEEIRKKILSETTITSLVQLEYNAFEAACVPVCTFTLKKQIGDKAYGEYVRLSEFKGADNQSIKVLEAVKDCNCGYRFKFNQAQFNTMPGMPIAYWVKNAIIDCFKVGKRVDSFAEPKQGLATADNNRFLRLWFEVDRNKICLKARNCDEAKKSLLKWFPYNKGGGFKKWYGNNEYIINWENDGMELRNFKGSVIRSPQYYFKEGISWCKITSSNFSMRYVPHGFLFDVAGCTLFTDQEQLFYLLGYMNSKVNSHILSLISPTLNFEVGHIGSLPILFSKKYKDEIEILVKQNIELCKKDWDSYEKSWDFERNPLIGEKGLLSEIYAEYCEEKNFEFLKVKENEKRINEIFGEIYNVNAVISADVEDDEITISKPNYINDMKALISYAVGCMLGRYSIDKSGLVFAGENWNNLDSETFPVDADNIIPICDEEYFDDDIVGMFERFIATTFGEENVKENMLFISHALSKEDDYKKIFRQYFLNDFYTDHCNLYTSRGAGKRPIYWLFDSGKQNGFKALIYMHRYDADTVGRVRTDYLHRAQKYVETAMQSAQYTIDNASSVSEKSKATKAVTKYTKQLAEMKIYDEAIAHIANKRIEIDLDDGVKVNYEKFQGVEVAQEGKKALKVDLLAKLK